MAGRVASGPQVAAATICQGNKAAERRLRIVSFRPQNTKHTNTETTTNRHETKHEKPQVIEQ